MLNEYKQTGQKRFFYFFYKISKLLTIFKIKWLFLWQS